MEHEKKRNIEYEKKKTQKRLNMKKKKRKERTLNMKKKIFLGKR